MKSSIVFLGLALFVGASASPSRIINGNPTTINRHPSVVQVEAQHGTWPTYWSHQCGGVILNELFILSAAQCFSGPNYTPAHRRIRAGTEQLGGGNIIVYITHAINHPSFGQRGFDGDISVVRLASSLILSSPNLGQASIPRSAHLAVGTAVTKVGWGSTSANSEERSPVLRELPTQVFNHQFCKLNYQALGSPPSPVTENMFCAGSGADACTGDEGGPVFIGNIVVGIISWRFSCGVPGFPGVNTDVSAYANWIQQVAV